MVNERKCSHSYFVYQIVIPLGIYEPHNITSLKISSNPLGLYVMCDVIYVNRIFSNMLELER